MTALFGPDTGTASGGHGPPPGPAAPGEPPGAGQLARRRWRASRGIVLTLLALILLAISLAALKPSVEPQYLDPESEGQTGTRALVQILNEHGTPVQISRNPADAAVRSVPGSVLVITRADRLTKTDLGRLRNSRGDLLLVEPEQRVLDALAPGVREAVNSAGRITVQPGCDLAGAVRAGAVDFKGSVVYEAPKAATACYADSESATDGLARLVQLSVSGRTVTVLGSGAPLTNGQLTAEGNAALGMNLAGAGSSAVWLMPEPPSGEEAGQESTWDLVPFGVKLFGLQLLIAVVLVALWRARRLGPVVAEALPVIVRSAETVEGRSRLYRAHHARDRAADQLRSGTRERLVPLLGLPRSAAQDPAAAQEIVTAVAQRTEWDEATVGTALYGPEPIDDQRLVGLSDFLDDLERQVRTS